MIYRFKFGTDGEAPMASVTAYKGALYGTTLGGGDAACNRDVCGTVFKLAPSRSGYGETVVHRFHGKPDGANPYADLLLVNGSFYGTTAFGGTGDCNLSYSPGCGTIFKIDASTGAESVVYRFKGGKDGASPMAGLTPMNGELYGTTFAGGGSGCDQSSASYIGCGTIFRFDPGTGVESIVYRFLGGADGASPSAPLAALEGTLYGTTTNGGGVGTCEGFGCGTVFGVTPAGTETFLQQVQGYGIAPAAGLAVAGGNLVATTMFGLPYSTECPNGCGTVLQISPTKPGATLLYQFTGDADGRFPEAGLLDIGNTLFGTANEGGLINSKCTRGCGTVFALSP